MRSSWGFEKRKPEPGDHLPRLDALSALGYNCTMFSCAIPGMLIELRQQQMTRFAEEIRPRYSKAMRRQAA